MNFMRQIGTSAAALAMVTMVATPAFADRGRRHFRDNDRIDGGDVLTGLLILGGIAAIASAAGRREREDRYPPPPPPSPDNDDDYGYSDSPDTQSVASEDEAVDACAVAAEEEGRRYNRLSRVQDVTDVDRAGSGWYVQGTVELRDGYRDVKSFERRFSCSVGPAGVQTVRIEGLNYASR